MPVIAASPSAEVERYQNTITGTSGRRSGVYPLASCAVLLVFCNDNNIYRWLSESCAPVRFIHFLTTWQSVKPNRLLHKVVWRQLRHGDTGHLALFITITRCTVSAKPGNTTNIHRRGWPAVMGSYPPWQSLNVPACWYVVAVLHDKFFSFDDSWRLLKSFIPGVKPSFSSSGLTAWFPRLFTVTSEHIRFLRFSFSVLHFLVVGSVL